MTMDQEEDEDLALEEDDEEEEDQDEIDDEEAELEELAFEMIKPRRRIGRPPREWSSILLPKEVTATLGPGNREPPNGAITTKPGKRARKGMKNSNPIKGIIDGEDKDNNTKEDGKLGGSLVGQFVHGVVDGSFDAGFLVTLRMGESDTLYRGMIFGPGLSIPVSRDNDIAKTVKRRRRRRLVSPTLDEPSSVTTTTTTHPTTSSTSLKEEQQPTHVQSYVHEHHPRPSHDLHPRPSDTHSRPLDPPPPSSSASLPNSSPYPYHTPFNQSVYRPVSHPPDINVTPFVHPNSFPHSPAVMPFPSQPYNSRPNFGNGLPPTPTTHQFGYTPGAQQGRPTTPLHSHYQGS